MTNIKFDVTRTYDAEGNLVLPDVEAPTIAPEFVQDEDHSETAELPVPVERVVI